MKTQLSNYNIYTVVLLVSTVILQSSMTHAAFLMLGFNARVSALPKRVPSLQEDPFVPSPLGAPVKCGNPFSYLRQPASSSLFFR